MYYINTLTMRYPMRTKDIRAENPDTSFPQIFVPPDNYKLVHPSDKPVFDEWTQDARELTPIEIDGVWTQQWEVVARFTEYTDEDGTVHTVEEQQAAYLQNRTEAAAAEIRSRRNTLLAESDWTQTVDSPVDQEAWAAYRQALRDISSQPDFPWSVTWPTAPV